MTIRILTAAVLLAIAPSFALAMGGCNRDHINEQVSSCADGYVWDSAAGTCVEQVTG